MCSKPKTILSTHSSLLHPLLNKVQFLLGTWKGLRQGKYPTITPFTYHEELSFTTAEQKPFIHLHQKTVALDGQSKLLSHKPLHYESGFLRVLSDTDVEMTIADPSGNAQSYSGFIKNNLNFKQLVLKSHGVITTPWAKKITQIHRSYDFTLDQPPYSLSYRIDMEAVGQPLQTHLEGKLTKTKEWKLAEEVNDLTVEEFRKDPQKFSVGLLDVREPQEWADGHIPGSFNLPLGYVLGPFGTHDPKLTQLQDVQTVVVCRSGIRARLAAEELVQNGWHSVYVLVGGYKAWSQMEKQQKQSG